MPINSYEDTLVAIGEPTDGIFFDDLDELGRARINGAPRGNLSTGNSPGRINRNPGQIERPQSQQRNDLSGDTRQINTPGTSNVPYETIDVPATRIPNNPQGSLPGQATPGGSLPGQATPRNLPPPRTAPPPQLPSAPVVPSSGNLPSGTPQPSPEGVEPSGAIQGGDGGEFEPIAEEGQVVNVYASFRIGLYRVTDGVRVGENSQGYFLRLTGVRGPVTPFRATVPGTPPGTRISIGFRYVDSEGNLQTLELVQTGSGNTDARLESFTVGTSPTNGAEAEPRRSPAPNTRGRRARRTPGTPPRPRRQNLPSNVPTPSTNQDTANRPGDSPQDAPFPFPSPNPSPSPTPTPTPTPTPAPVPAPTPQDAPRRVPAPRVPELPGLDDLCDFLRECLVPSLADQIRERLINEIIERLLDALLGGGCSLDDICEQIRTITDSLFASTNFQLARKNCEGKDIRVTSIGRRVENLLPSMEAGFRYTQELIEEKIPCGSYSQPKVIASGTTNFGSEVRYVTVANDVREVELALPGNIPQGLRIFRQSGPNEEQAKFGAIQEGLSGAGPTFAVKGEQQWVWTRNTLLRLDPFRGRTRVIRIFLEPQLQWVLYDTGLRI